MRGEKYLQLQRFLESNGSEWVDAGYKTQSVQLKNQVDFKRVTLLNTP